MESWRRRWAVAARRRRRRRRFRRWRSGSACRARWPCSGWWQRRSGWRGAACADGGVDRRRRRRWRERRSRWRRGGFHSRGRRRGVSRRRRWRCGGRSHHCLRRRGRGWYGCLRSPPGHDRNHESCDGDQGNSGARRGLTRSARSSDGHRLRCRCRLASPPHGGDVGRHRGRRGRGAGAFAAMGVADGVGLGVGPGVAAGATRRGTTTNSVGAGRGGAAAIEVSALGSGPRAAAHRARPSRDGSTSVFASTAVSWIASSNALRSSSAV